MTARDPNLFGDSPSDKHESGADGLDLPLELYFAEDRGDPETVAAVAALEAGVLDRVGAERGFVSRRERKLIRACRGVVLTGALCVLLAAAVADRLGAAPWSPALGAAAAGPVSGLVASTSEDTAVTIERARDLRDRLLRVVSAPEPGEPPTVFTVTLRPAASDDSVLPAAHRPNALLSGDASNPAGRACGPYLTAKGFGTTRVSSVTTVIRFEDGFSVPAMAGDASAELRWPASREVTASVVSLEGSGSPWQRPVTLAPAWYAGNSPERPR